MENESYVLVLARILAKQCGKCSLGLSRRGCSIHEIVVQHPSTANSTDMDFFVKDGWCKFYQEK